MPIIFNFDNIGMKGKEIFDLFIVLFNLPGAAIEWFL